MKTNMYFLETITNLHMGDGDVNFNIIDNEVERDDLLGLPVMNSSGIKGALREYFRMKKSDAVVAIFGNENKKGVESKPGKVKFHNGECIAVSMRNSNGKTPFSVVTNEAAMENLEFKMEAVWNWKLDRPSKISAVEIEGFTGYRLDIFNTIFEQLDSQVKLNLAVLDYEDFKEVSLPVIARNELKDGISNNLWYEEYVPHHSVFFTFVSFEEDCLADIFDEQVNGKMIQFGANASIGQGFVKWIKVEGV